MTIYNKPVDGSINSMKDIYALTEDDVKYLALRAVVPDAASIIFGDYTKWASNLLFYPIDFTEEPRSEGVLTLNAIATDIPVKGIELWENGYTNGLDMGEIYYEGIRDSNYTYAEYEPYTTAQLYLPYYGYADLKIADILNKYIEVKLDIDLATGQALYTVLSSPISIPRIPKCKYWLYSSADYIGMRVIGTYTFQLGSPVPFGSSGMTDAIRNTLSTVVKGGATLAGFYAGGAVGGATTSTIVSTKQQLNPNTNRLKAVSRVTEQRTEETSPKQKGVETAFNTAGLALNNVMMSPVSDKANNNLLGLTSERQIVLIVRYGKLVEDDYSKLYGLPYGRVATLESMSGYTEISRIHVEGLTEAITDEIRMIERLLSDGIILPDNVT